MPGRPAQLGASGLGDGARDAGVDELVAEELGGGVARRQPEPAGEGDRDEGAGGPGDVPEADPPILSGSPQRRHDRVLLLVRELRVER